ncbi:hypothetical protein BWI17_10520 [Betaproteobacteria bacterium GR16-43]|nr:hypothetical protein BWI17_10520 [Betaproteobacteria bacterium GR16-43]
MNALSSREKILRRFRTAILVVFVIDTAVALLAVAMDLRTSLSLFFPGWTVAQRAGMEFSQGLILTLLVQVFAFLFLWLVIHFTVSAREGMLARAAGRPESEAPKGQFAYLALALSAFAYVTAWLNAFVSGAWLAALVLFVAAPIVAILAIRKDRGRPWLNGVAFLVTLAPFLALLGFCWNLNHIM